MDKKLEFRIENLPLVLPRFHGYSVKSVLMNEKQETIHNDAAIFVSKGIVDPNFQTVN